MAGIAVPVTLEVLPEVVVSLDLYETGEEVLKAGDKATYSELELREIVVVAFDLLALERSEEPDEINDSLISSERLFEAEVDELSASSALVPADSEKLDSWAVTDVDK